jgi:hypothetical protein
MLDFKGLIIPSFGLCRFTYMYIFLLNLKFVYFPVFDLMHLTQKIFGFFETMDERIKEQ